MEAKSPDLEKKAAESLIVGEDIKSTSSDISLKHGNIRGEERTDEKVKPVNISQTLVSPAQSSTVRCTAGKQETTSCAGPFPSTASETGEEVLRQAKETAASSNLSLCANIVSVCEDGAGGTEALDSSPSSLLSTTLMAAAESEGKDSGEDSAPAVPAIPTACKIQDEEVDDTPVSSIWDIAASVADSLSSLVGLKTTREDIPQYFTDNESNENVSNIGPLKCMTSEATRNEGESNTISTVTSSGDEIKTVEDLQVITRRNKNEVSTDSASGNDEDYGVLSTSASSHPPVTAGHSNGTDGDMKKSDNERGTFDSSKEEQIDEDRESDKRKAIFYLSSCSVPGMGEGSEWPSVSSGYQWPSNQRTRAGVVPSNNREPRLCFGSRRCHYAIVAIALLTSIMGCVTYHLQDSGIGPEVLKPIGASTAFISFAVFAVSVVYLTYLNNLPQVSMVPNYELLGDVDSVMAMNRIVNPECHYSEQGYYISRSLPASPEKCTREIQSADILDRRGYGRLSTETVQNFEYEPGPSGLAQSSTRTGTSATGDASDTSEIIVHMVAGSATDVRDCNEQDIEAASDDQALVTPQSSHYASAELPPAEHRSSGEYFESDTTPLLQKKI